MTLTRPTLLAALAITACTPAVGPGPSMVSALPIEGIQVNGITATSAWLQSSGDLLDTIGQEMDFTLARCAGPRPGSRPASVKYHIERVLYDGRPTTLRSYREQTLIGRVEVTARRPRQLLLRAPVAVTIYVDPLRESDEVRERALARAFADRTCALMTAPA